MNGNHATKFLPAALILLPLLFGSSIVGAQQSSEQYIPIGRSPGISNTSSYIGTITSKDSATPALTVLTDDGGKTVKIMPTTRIWLDRSKNSQANIEAEFEQLETGSRIEVLPSREDRAAADWVKVESL